jgi:molybdenum cofactor cytidylyltransferase
MIRPDRVALVLLAAGLSHRFGTEDKLAAPFRGRPLAHHAADTLAGIAFAERFVVVGAGPSVLAGRGFTLIANPVPEVGQSRSVALGVEAARAAGARAVLIALADMPLVTIGHIRRLLMRYEDAHSIVASGDGARRAPPALFGRAHFDALCDLEGDGGARALLARAAIVPVTPGELADIDTPTDLAGLQRDQGDRLE